MQPFDISDYLGRIGLDGADRSVRGLAALMAAQMRAIPFENFDPFLGATPSLDLRQVAAKLVARRRGGYCFEQNLLLEAALAALGFETRRILARVRMGAAEGGPRTHLALVTRIYGRRLLTDAGFGGPGALMPLDIDVEAPQDAPNGTFRLRRDAVTGERVVERRQPDGWFALYGFDDAWVGAADLTCANHYCATAAEAPFGSHIMLAGWDGDTRIGVFDLGVTEDGPQGSARRSFENEADFRATMARIGLGHDAGLLARVWARLTIADKALA